VGRYWVYLLAAGGGIAYAGSSGRVEERLRRHFRGYSSAAVRGLRTDAAYALACTREQVAGARMGDVVAQGLPAALRREGTRREAEEASPPAARVVHLTGRGLRAGPPAALRA